MEIVKKRAGLLRAVRSFFYTEGLMETDPPLATPWPTLDANIDSVSISSSDSAHRPLKLFLHTSPEHAMKKMLAAGCGDIYFLGKVFRDREITSQHNIEFTMAEWYVQHATYREIMDMAERLIVFCAESVNGSTNVCWNGTVIDLSPPWERISVRDLFLRNAGIDLNDSMETEALHKAAGENGIILSADDDWDTAFNKIFLERIEPALNTARPCFVTDYPSHTPLMAAKKKSDPRYVERTELFIGGLELANGYTELTDSRELLERFKSEGKIRPGLPIDHELIQALEHGIPQCSGIALGIDRLLMLLTDKHDIEEVILFPAHQMRFSGL